MAIDIDELNLTIPVATEQETQQEQEQQLVLIENFTLLLAYCKELEARIVALEAFHP